MEALNNLLLGNSLSLGGEFRNRIVEKTLLGDLDPNILTDGRLFNFNTTRTYGFSFYKGEDNEYTPTSGQDNIYDMCVDGEGYLYAVCYTSPLRVLKIDTESMELVKEYVAPSGYNNGRCILYDGEYVWVGLETSPYLLRLSKRLELESTYSAIGWGVYSLAHNDDSVFGQNNGSTNPLVRVEKSSGMVHGPYTYSLAGDGSNGPKGLYWSGVYLYSVTRAGKVIWTDSSLTEVDRTNITAYTDSKEFRQCCSDGNHLFIATDNNPVCLWKWKLGGAATNSIKVWGDPILNDPVATGSIVYDGREHIHFTSYEGQHYKVRTDSLSYVRCSWVDIEGVNAWALTCDNHFVYIAGYGTEKKIFKRLNSRYVDEESPGEGGNTWMRYGSYTGDGTDDRDIFVGFRPSVVIVKRDGASAGVFRTRSHSSNSCSRFTASGNLANAIQDFTRSGFVVGTDATVNSNGDTYYWIAWR